MSEQKPDKIKGRCYECKHHKPTSKYRGWCVNPKFDKKIRVEAVDYCKSYEPKEGT